MLSEHLIELKPSLRAASHLLRESHTCEELKKKKKGCFQCTVILWDAVGTEGFAAWALNGMELEHLVLLWEPRGRGLVHSPDSWIGPSCEWCAGSCAACEVFHHIFSPCAAWGVVTEQLCGARLPTSIKAQQQCGANACLQAGKDLKCTERLAGTR